MKLKIAALIALWALFSVFGILFYEKTKTVDTRGLEFVSVAGLDGDVYLRRYCHVYSLLQFRKRHPAEAVVSAPFIVVGSSVAEKAGEEAGKIALILLAAVLATATVLMLYLVVGDLGAVALWLSFAYVWLLASSPELMAVSQAILVGTLLLVRRRVRDLRVWTGMALLAGGTTVTNVVKPVAAWGVGAFGDSATVRELRRHVRTVLWLGAGLLGVLLVVEVVRWLSGASSLQLELASAADYLTKWSATRFGWGERLARTWEMFFLEPMMTHGAIFGPLDEATKLDLLPLGYANALPHVVGGALVGLCGWSAWRNRGDAVVRAALAMTAFDFLLHVVVGWGLIEAQIYCGHWLYVVPVLVAGLPGRWWKFAVAALVAGWNLLMLEF